MRSFMFFILYISLLHQSAWGTYHKNFINKAPPYEKNYDNILYSSKNIENHFVNTSNESSDVISNALEQENLESFSELLTNESSSQTDQSNSTFTVSASSQSTVYSTDSVPDTQSTHKMATLTEIFSSESNSPISIENSSSSSSSTHIGETKSSIKSTNSVTPTNQAVNESSSTTEDDEPEGVVRGKPTGAENITTTTSQPQTVYQKALALMNDTYTLSIIIPVAAGIVFASTIIVTVATCRCLNRRCRRRRLRRKVLPDSVKNMRPSDRARLLAESSDEEF